MTTTAKKHCTEKKLAKVWLMSMAVLFGLNIVPSDSRNQTLAAEQGFNQPILALPATGTNLATSVSGVAPLEIRTSASGGYHYLVKLVNRATNNVAGSYFIRSGESISVEVPVGSYEIRYASGKNWYGPTYLFGPDTLYSKADSIFDFTFNGYQYSGYSVELIMQPNGNLSTSRLNPAQW